MCNHMYSTRDIYGHPVKVPCGSCVTCRRTQSTFWSHRIQSDIAELEKSGTGSSFVTLTLESDTTPILSKSDLQKFFKRLRKSCPDYPFKYLAIGDYGENTFRPHYHALLIGFPPELSALVRKNWSLGFVDVDAVCTGNVNYVVRYMQARNVVANGINIINHKKNSSSTKVEIKKYRQLLTVLMIQQCSQTCQECA